MQNRYIPNHERLQKVIKLICDNYWISKLQEAKFDAKQIEALSKLAQEEWEKALPKNKNILSRLFDKKWDQQSTQCYEKVKLALTAMKDETSLKDFYQIIQNMQIDNAQLNKDIEKLMRCINNNIGKTIPFFYENAQIFNANLYDIIKEWVNAYLLNNLNLIQNKQSELLNKTEKTEIENEFIKVASSEGGYTAWERLEVYFKVDGYNEDKFFNELIAQLKLQFIPREEVKFVPFKNIG